MAKKKAENLLDGYVIVKRPIDEISLNPSNPRVIEDAKFAKLVTSIKEAPWMLKIRPIVCNKDDIVLGGNQRLKACREAGLTHVYVINADDLDDEMQREFLIKDNLDFGKWDMELLKVNFDMEKLDRWGFEVQPVSLDVGSVDTAPPPPLNSDDAAEPEFDKNELDRKLDTYNNNTIKQIVLYYPTDIYEKVLKSLDEISKALDCDDNSEVILRLISHYEFNNGVPENETLAAKIDASPDGVPESDLHSDEGESWEDEDG